MTNDEKVGRTWLDLIYSLIAKFIKLKPISRILIIICIIIVFVAISFFSYWKAEPGERIPFLFGLVKITKPVTDSTLVEPENLPGKEEHSMIQQAEKTVSKPRVNTSGTHKPEKDQTKTGKSPLPAKYLDFTVLIKSENGNMDWNINHKIGMILNEKGFTAGSSAIFTNKFVSSSRYERIFSGSPAEVTALDLDDYIGRLLLGKKSVSFNEDSNYEGLITATVSIELHIISTETGTIDDSFTITERGAGYTKSNAEEIALGNVMKTLLKRL